MVNPSVPRGKVGLAPFPFDDLSAGKVRPAICPTDPVGQYRHVVLAFITSRVTLDDAEETDVVLEPSQPSFAATGLRAPSTIRLHRLMTVSESFILRELGELSPETQSQVAGKLRLLFGLR